MVIFHSYVKLPEGTICPVGPGLCSPSRICHRFENSAPDEVHSVQDFLQRAHAEMPDARRGNDGNDAMLGVFSWG